MRSENALPGYRFRRLRFLAFWERPRELRTQVGEQVKHPSADAMRNFEYTRARSVDGAVRLLTPESRFLAGGVDLFGEMKDYIVSPKRVIDLKQIPGLDQIDTTTDTWKLGANVTIAELARNDAIKVNLPGLAEAASEVGSPQIRNVATLGGNLAQHSRC